MKMSKIKIVVSDIDGTFIDDNKQVSPNTIKAIQKIKRKGLLFALCSGREPNTIKNLAMKWGIISYVDIIIGFNGGQIIYLKNNKVENTYFLSELAIKDIIDHFKDMELNFAIPDKGFLYFPKEDKFVNILSKYDDMPYIITNYDTYLNEPKPKLMIITKEANMSNVIERSSTLNSKHYHGKPVQTGKFLFEYMHENVNKAKAIEIAIKKYGLKMENVLAFGDAENDVEMIDKSGIGVAMGNACKNTKDVSDFITDDNNNDGIYKFVQSNLD